MLYGLRTFILSKRGDSRRAGFHANPVFHHLKRRWVMDVKELKKALKGFCVATLLSGASLSMAASSG
jgi:radical SAM modification target selenobiotic family peptide